MKIPLHASASGLLVFHAMAVLALAQHDMTGPAAGEELSGKSKLLRAGSEIMQREGPVGSIHARLCGFHFYNGDIKRQVHAEHYCTHLNEDFIQCVLYDSDKKDARLVGVEYVISEKLFRQLPDEEKKLWHSHRHEVKSGQLLAPGLPDAAEKELMEKLVNTYGKTWQLWQTDRGDTVPLGVPQLMMGFTADGQLEPALSSARDEDVGISTEETRRKRVDIKASEIAPGADAWQKGQVFQIREDGTAGSTRTR